MAQSAYAAGERVERLNIDTGLFDIGGTVIDVNEAGVVFVTWDDYPRVILAYEPGSRWIRPVEIVPVEIEASCDYCYARVHSGRCRTPGCRGSI